MKLGEMNSLVIDRFTSVGAYLVDDEGGDVLLPNKYLTSDLREGETISVFIYRDSEDRLVATTEIPFLFPNTFAFLKITDVTFFGAFADWGLEKELLIPFREQTVKAEIGKNYLIYLKRDDATDRLFGSMKVAKNLKPCSIPYNPGQQVDLLVWEKTDLGMKVIVDQQYSGLIFNNDITRELRTGDKLSGYVRNLRPDGKFDLTLHPDGYNKIDEAAEKLLRVLNKRNGVLHIGDHSSSEEIKNVLEMSKKTFKQAIGQLYKKRLIELTENGIRLSASKGE